MKALSSRIFRIIFLVALVTVLLCGLLMGLALYDSLGQREQRELASELALIEQTLPPAPDSTTDTTAGGATGGAAGSVPGNATDATTDSATNAASSRAAYLAQLGTDDIRVTWVAPNGEVRYDSRTPDPTTLDNHANRPEVATALATGQGEATRYSSTLGEVTFYHTLRLDDGSVLRLSRSQNSALALLFGLILPAALVIAFFAIAAGIIAHLMAARISAPLNTLNLDEPLDNDVYTELRPLFTRMEEQRREIARQMDEAASSRREFTANVSHELKTPLTVISGYAELMKNGLVQPQDVPHFSELIFDEAGHVRELVEDILVLSQLDESDGAGRAPDAVELIDLRQLASEVMERLTPFAQQNEVSSTLDGRGDAHVSGSRRILTSIIYNLYENAIRYNRPGGSVSITIEDIADAGAAGGAEAGGATTGIATVIAEEREHMNRPHALHALIAEGVRLRITDTGVGISPTDQARVFERFFRVDKTRSRETGGTGLGLAIVKHGAQLHGAQLTLDSTPGEGTTITLVFPK
jgi:two-component system phosphate regulon sensor histidine kinase PhoR